MSVSRFVALYSQALAWVGSALLIAVLIADPRWLGQIPEIVCCSGAALRSGPLRSVEQVLVSDADSAGRVAGSLLVVYPRPRWRSRARRSSRFAVAAQTAARLVDQSGRETITLVAAYGVYAAACSGWVTRA